jgi:anti-sigma B factor antagonist
MKFALEKKGKVVLITIKASLEGGPDTFQIKDEVKAQLGKGERSFILDMKEAGFVNSTGIGVVVSCLSSIKGAGGALRVSGVSERARRAFVTTGVLQLFDLYPDVEAAMAAAESA